MHHPTGHFLAGHKPIVVSRAAPVCAGTGLQAVGGEHPTWRAIASVIVVDPISVIREGSGPEVPVGWHHPGQAQVLSQRH